jgi:hypothetical protein
MMSIEATKVELTKRIMDVQDPDTLERIKSFLSEKDGDFWEQLTEDQKSEIRLGIEQLDKGQGVTFDDFLRKHS